MPIIKRIISFLKKNSFRFFAFLMLSGCTTSSYKISNTDLSPNRTYGKYEVLVTPDRVLLDCENLQTEDVVSYGFSIFVLDEEKTVASIV